MATQEKESTKQHGDKLNAAIPAADNGSHDRSAAAHLGKPGHDHTKPAGDLRADVDRKDSRNAFRGEATRGH